MPPKKSKTPTMKFKQTSKGKGPSAKLSQVPRNKGKSSPNDTPDNAAESRGLTLRRSTRKNPDISDASAKPSGQERSIPATGSDNCHHSGLPKICLCLCICFISCSRCTIATTCHQMGSKHICT